MDFIQDFTGCDCTGPLEKELKQSNICGCSEPPLCHQPARSLLQDWIGDQKKFLKILENLEKNYPPSLPPEADEALWQILNRARRGNRGTSSIF